MGESYCLFLGTSVYVRNQRYSSSSFLVITSLFNFVHHELITATKMASRETQPRQNYHENCEAAINKQINLELYASYVYSSMAFYFDRDDVSLPGFHKYFKEASHEEREHAEKFMKYQNMRGGRIVLQDVQKPERDEWGTGLEAMQCALALEKRVNQSLLDLHKLADTHDDGQLTDFIEGEYLKEQVEAIKTISDYITQLKRCGPGLGEYMFDKELQS